jgi:uncharacterized membrane protein YukC
MKQGEEQTKFVKEPQEPTRNYIFQKNQKTKIGTYIVIGFLVLLIFAVIVSLVYFGFPEM